MKMKLVSVGTVLLAISLSAPVVAQVGEKNRDAIAALVKEWLAQLPGEGGLITTQVDTSPARPECTGHQDQAPTAQSVLGSAVAVKASFQACNILNH